MNIMKKRMKVMRKREMERNKMMTGRRIKKHTKKSVEF